MIIAPYEFDDPACSSHLRRLKKRKSVFLEVLEVSSSIFIRCLLRMSIVPFAFLLFSSLKCRYKEKVSLSIYAANVYMLHHENQEIAQIITVITNISLFSSIFVSIVLNFERMYIEKKRNSLTNMIESTST